ncbi:MAG: HlyD family secretion protein [Bacteroidia bacterium]|nr:HlyD family secretion protein [Bacteroidia bacterium]
MLNISPNRIEDIDKMYDYDSFDQVYKARSAKKIAYWIVGILISGVVILFLPWTQNIRAEGNLTTLRPSQRPQEIHSTIAGRIEAWYVNEGDTVYVGDTIVFLSEIKDAYFDPELIARIDMQIEAKLGGIEAYTNKAEALAGQIRALEATRALKVSQAINKVTQTELKVQSDSIDLVAEVIALDIAEIQFARADTLFKQDLKSRADWEEKRNKMMEAKAKFISQQNKLDGSKQELTIVKIDQRNVLNDYQEKIAKANSDRQSALSDLFAAQGDVAKLRNQRSNYEVRVGFRYITAPQEGFVNKALKPGIGETVKEGEAIVSIVPIEQQQAAEIFVRPVDVPLVLKGEHVRLEFDGWPALVFSGWPNTSFGTFGGRVFAIENDISTNGLYRILIEPDPEDEPWPIQLRVGSGVRGFALLDDVPLWYELWRQLNGFPPNYYTGNGTDKAKAGKGK